MDTFVKKIVEKATKKPGGNLESLKPADVDPHVAFHYGIPSGSTKMAYDSIQKTFAISTKVGQIKLFGKDNTQALLESKERLPSKFLQFIDCQGILLNVTIKNHIEVWDIDRKVLLHVHDFEGEITALTIIQHCRFILVGDSVGNVTVFNIEPCHLVKMNYRIPVSASRGNSNEAVAYNAVTHILPQPMAESKRILLIFRDGLITLWEIRENKAIFTTGGGGTIIQSSCHEMKKVTCACWMCPFGSKIVLGYNNGEVLIYSIPSASDNIIESKTNTEFHVSTQKLNLGFKSDNVPIAKLKWVYADEKATRLYVMGFSDSVSMNMVQVILLNDHTESRTIKTGLQLPEPCLDMEIISEESKHKQGFLLLLGKSGHIYAYEDHLIEKHLLQSQLKSPPSIPQQVKIKLPFADSSITTSTCITNNSCWLSCGDEDYLLKARNIPSVLPAVGKQLEATSFIGFSKIKNVYITGHSDGVIKFWDATCPLFLPLFSLKHQSEANSSSGAVAITAIFYESERRLLISGDQSGMVHIYKFKPEPFSSEVSFIPGISKKGNQNVIHCYKTIKVNGSVLFIKTKCNSTHVAVGSDQGYISVIDVEGPTLLYEKHVASELSTGIVSLQFGSCIIQGFERNLLVAATRDSSVLALDGDNGNTICNSMVQPKKPSKALFMQILDGRGCIVNGPTASDNLDLRNGVSADESAQKLQYFVLLCSEKASYVYSLEHVAQGIKKWCYKEKFSSSSCCWASTFSGSASNAGLILLFTCGKIEIRSLLKLSLVSETTLRGFTYLPSKPNSHPEISICSSIDGSIILVRSDQEVSTIPLLPQKQMYRHLDSLSQVFDKNLVPSEDVFIPTITSQKEKKKGIFGSIMKDMKSSKPKHEADTTGEDVKASFDELSTVFSVSNFSSTIAEHKDSQVSPEDGADLDIDDIDLGDLEEKPKGHSVMASLNKQKLASTFYSFKGKLKQMTAKNDKASEKAVGQEEPGNEKAGTVDQIKKKYGFSASSEVSAAIMAETKLSENLQKLQGISLKSTEMQDNAQSFSSMAKDLLRMTEKQHL